MADTLTITSAGTIATAPVEPLDTLATQLAFPFVLDQAKLSEFLARWLAIEDEEDRLREDKRLLKEAYAEAFPMRGVLTAIKIIRATAKLEEHPKDSMQRVHLAHLEALVEQYLLGARQALADLQTAFDAQVHEAPNA